MQKNDPDTFVIDGHTITCAKQIPAFLEKASHKEHEVFANLVQKAQINPLSCIAEIKALSERFPSSAEVDNLLLFVLLQSKKIDKPDAMIQQHFTKHPEYFFARINYGDLLLRKKKWKEFLKIFPSDDIHHYLQKNETIHVCQYRSFMTLMSHFYLIKKDPTKARFFYEKAYAVDPADPSICHLEKILFHKNFFQRIFSLIKAIFQCSSGI